MEEYLKDINYNFVIFATLWMIALCCERLFKPEEPDVGMINRETKSEVVYPFFNTLFLMPLSYFIIMVMQGLDIPLHIMQEGIEKQNIWIQAFIALVLFDFVTYWRHRLTHAYAWKFHAVHHSAEHITWLTNFRMHFVDYIIALFFSTITVYVLGFEGMALIYASLFYVFYSTFLHFNIKLDYPAPIKYIFASPHLHRWHHAKDKKSMDKNYANLFSFFDVVFGSYYSPIESPEKYGIFERKNKKTPLTFLGQLIYPFKS